MGLALRLLRGLACADCRGLLGLRSSLGLAALWRNASRSLRGGVAVNSSSRSGAPSKRVARASCARTGRSKMVAVELGPARALREEFDMEIGLRGEAEAGLRGDGGAAAKGRIGSGARGNRLGIRVSPWNLVRFQPLALNRISLLAFQPNRFTQRQRTPLHAATPLERRTDAAGMLELCPLTQSTSPTRNPPTSLSSSSRRVPSPS